MLIATMLLVFQLVVSDGLIQDQGRSTQVAQAQSQKPQAARPVLTLDDGRMAPRVRTERREALIHLVKGDDRLAVRLPSKNPRVQIVWFYDPARPKVESPEHEDEGVIPSS